MPASEIRKKTIYFVLSAGVLILILLLFPVQKSLGDYVAAGVGLQFGLLEDGSYALSPKPGEEVWSMAEAVFSVVYNLLKLLKIVIWLALIVVIVRFVAFVITKTTSRKSASQSEIVTLLRTIVSVVIYIVAFFIIFQTQYPNVQLAPLFTGSTIIGIVVGLALQDTLGNLFAGLALSADQPFQVGDFIILASRGEGVVESVSWRGVKIRTSSNKVLVISNSVLGKEIIEVAPKNNLNAKSVFFNTEYTHSPAKTIQVVREAVRHIDNVSSKMRPVVRVRNLGDNGFDWEVKYWLDDYTKQHDTDALIRQRIWYVFKREKIQFAQSSHIVHMEERSVELPPEEVFNTISDRLSQIPIFSPLDDEEIERLANATTSRVYAPGEAIVRRGQVGNSMFVITRGSVKVQIPERDYQKTINTLKENDFFGEMSLLTGEPRSANVIAVEEAEVLRIDKNGLKPIFESNPDLVQTISELIEERRLLLTRVDLEEEEKPVDAGKRGMMRSIRSFFGLK